MPLTNLNIGAAPNDGTGETLRSGGAKINTNYTFTVTTDTAQDISGVKNFQSETQTRDINIRVASSSTNYVGRPDRMFIEFERPTANGGIISFHTTPSTAGALAERMRIDSNGTVGIGHSPTNKLSVFTSGGGNTSGFSVGSSNGLLNIWGGASSDIVFDITNGTLNGGTGTNFQIRQGGSNVMRIAAGGNVGIGTTSPATLLHVNGTLRHGANTQAAVNTAAGTFQDTVFTTAINFGGASVMQSAFGDVPTVGEFYAYELGTTNRLLAVFYKTGTGSAASVTVLASSVLTLGASNSGGTQVINNATNNNNVRMIAIIRRVF
jgi:hypothetical protein